jgi:hypothetical protein
MQTQFVHIARQGAETVGLDDHSILGMVVKKKDCYQVGANQIPDTCHNHGSVRETTSRMRQYV